MLRLLCLSFFITLFGVFSWARDTQVIANQFDFIEVLENSTWASAAHEDSSPLLLKIHRSVEGHKETLHIHLEDPEGKEIEALELTLEDAKGTTKQNLGSNWILQSRTQLRLSKSFLSQSVMSLKTHFGRERHREFSMLTLNLEEGLLKFSEVRRTHERRGLWGLGPWVDSEPESRREILFKKTETISEICNSLLQ